MPRRFRDSPYDEFHQALIDEFSLAFSLSNFLGRLKGIGQDFEMFAVFKPLDPVAVSTKDLILSRCRLFNDFEKVTDRSSEATFPCAATVNVVNLKSPPV